MNACLEWNTQNPVPKCVGVTWSGGSYGPGGAADGSGCVLRWNMNTNGTIASIGSDSAILQGVMNPPVSIHFFGTKV